MEVDCAWPLPPTDISLSGDMVHVWCACLNQFDNYVEQIALTLSPDEMKRAERFRLPQHRNQFITAHGLLRKLLADYTNIDAGGISFSYGRNGKPFLSKQNRGKKIRFNLSHSNGYALFAFACDREIGVDIEYIKALTEMEGVAVQVFSTKETAVLRSFPESEKKEAFFIFWTRKEAYIKAIGEGLSSALEKIDISSHPINAPVLVDERGNLKYKNYWYIQDLMPVPGFAAALAVEGGQVKHRYWRIPKSFLEYCR